MNDLNPKSFPYVLCEELLEIEKSRALRRSWAADAGPKASAAPSGPPPPGEIGQQTAEGDPPAKTSCSEAGDEICREAAAKSLFGLAFSGGGIRSATFNLGVLQGLARYGLLPRVDYLSTVSGGGYIGGWLTAWLRRKGLWEVLDGLKGKDLPPGKPEAHPIRYLRRFSNYLTPKTGIFSADTWTMVAIYLRNVILNLTILILALAAILVIPKLIAFCTANAHNWLSGERLLGLSLLAALPAVFFTIRNLASISLPSCQAASGHATDPKWFMYPLAVQAVIVAPVFVSAWFLSVALIAIPDFPIAYAAWAALAVAALILILGLIGGGRENLGVRLLSVGFGSLVAAAALYSVSAGLRDGLPYALAEHLEFLTVEQAQAVWGAPVVIAAFSLAGTFYIGFMRTRLDTAHREWWARLGAWLLIYTLAWIGLLLISLGSTTLLTQKLGPGIGAALGSGWLVTTIGGLLAGKSSTTGGKDSTTGGKDSSPWMERLAKVAPYVFVAGLLVLLAMLVDRVGLALRPSWINEPAIILGAAAALIALSLLLSWRVDINQFSMHNFYRNRLVRGYIGASCDEEKRHPFTGFDPDDNLVRISDLLVTPPPDPENAQRPADFSYPKRYAGPYHVVNAALNLVSGEDLAWQTRKASSFVFTPKYSGAGECYRPTEHFDGGMSLGTAVTISGGATSPNMGYHTSAPLAFLMTVFNVRLGWWLGNPKYEAWRKPGPTIGLKYLFLELFALTNSARAFVYLSDGGHFENLGIYELVRRRCQYIVACDAEQDGDLNFDGLGNAIEKCRTDFGVEIDIDTDLIRGTKREPQKGRHCAVGTIRYKEGLTGTLLYIKSSLTEDEPADVERYAAQNKEFPHEATGDQWFDETQFESYRELGLHIADSVLQAVGDAAEVSRMPTEELFVKLRQRWHAPSEAVAAAFTKHATQIDRIFREIRETKELRFLDAQIYPEWRRLVSDPEIADRTNCGSHTLWLPGSCEELRAGFYISQQVIQLMECVYLDLNLEKEHGHPDNRRWMNLFRHWSWSGMFRVTWAISASTYGARFQEFCRRRLDLEVGELALGKPFDVPQEKTVRDEDWKKLEADLVLNFYEASLLRRLTDLDAHKRTYQLFPLQITVFSPQRDKNIWFTFGFALTERRSLRFFRVQDHLRKMGLGRAALAQLIESAGVEQPDLGDLPEGDEFPSPCQRRSFERMFHSVLVELGRKPLEGSRTGGEPAAS